MPRRAIAQNPAFWSRSGNSTSANDVIGTLNNQSLVFISNGNEAFRISPAGNMGIGLTNPLYRLDVDGSLQVSNKIFASSVVCDGLSEFSFLHVHDSLQIGTSSIWLGGNDLSTGSNNTFFTTSGDLIIQSTAGNFGTILNVNLGFVGIGTYAPQKKLHVTHVIPQGSDPRIAAVYDYSMPDTSMTAFLISELDSVTIRDYMPGSLRLETKVNGGSTSMWDIEPIAAKFPTDINKLNFTDPQHGRTIMTLSSDGKYGNVGIGTMNPLQKLHVHNGNIYITGHNSSILFGNGSAPQVGWGNYGIEYLPENTTQNNAGGLNFWRPFGSSGGYQNFIFHLADNGNVGIGTGDPEYKLDVCGTIRTNELITEPKWWPDFVFDDDYFLEPFNERIAGIKQNKCLPGLPSEETVLTSGANMNEVMQGLLKNMEELYLYIEQLELEIHELRSDDNRIKQE
jgi:hypothetical protein